MIKLCSHDWKCYSFDRYKCYKCGTVIPEEVMLEIVRLTKRIEILQADCDSLKACLVSPSILPADCN